MESESAFTLNEYVEACQRFFWEAAQAVARASDPILGQLRYEVSESVPRFRHTMPSGEVLEMAPLETSTLITFSNQDGIDGRLDDFHSAVAHAATSLIDSIMPQLFAQISRLTDATGNVVDASGKSPWDAQLEALEVIEISFDEEGNPILPTIVMNPATAEKLGQPPEDFSVRFANIVNRKRDEWLAQRRTRRLPRQGE